MGLQAPLRQAPYSGVRGRACPGLVFAEAKKVGEAFNKHGTEQHILLGKFQPWASKGGI